MPKKKEKTEGQMCSNCITHWDNLKDLQKKYEALRKSAMAVQRENWKLKRESILKKKIKDKFSFWA